MMMKDEEDKDYDAGMFYLKLEKINDAIPYFLSSKHPDAENQLEKIREKIRNEILNETVSMNSLRNNFIIYAKSWGLNKEE